MTELAAGGSVSREARARMQANKRRDTGPELAVRRELHARGLRYRVDFAPLGGVRRRADVVFTKSKVVLFIDGCFWHGCPDHGTAQRAKTNAAFWSAKVLANQVRDRDTDHRLRSAGWMVLRAWEHEAPQDVANRVVAALDTRG